MITQNVTPSNERMVKYKNGTKFYPGLALAIIGLSGTGPGSFLDSFICSTLENRE